MRQHGVACGGERTAPSCELCEADDCGDLDCARDGLAPDDPRLLGLSAQQRELLDPASARPPRCVDAARVRAGLRAARRAAKEKRGPGPADQAYQLEPPSGRRSDADRQAAYGRVQAAADPQAALEAERLRLRVGSTVQA